jgi:hypothetical protein
MPVLDILGMKKDDRRQRRRGSAFRPLSLDQDWLFGGKLDPAALQPGFDDKSVSKITLIRIEARHKVLGRKSLTIRTID